MAESVIQTCSRCGKPLDAFAPRGICVHCVLEGGLLPAADELETVRQWIETRGDGPAPEMATDVA